MTYSSNFSSDYGFNKKSDGGLEDIISKGYYGGLKPSLPAKVSPAEYDELVSLAQEDDFQKVIDRCQALGQRASAWGERGTLNARMKQAHEIYATTQKQLAVAFAQVGDFESAERHISNASISIGGDLSLASRLSESEIEEVIGVAIQNTNPEYFFRKLENAVESGDVKKTRKYIHLATRALEQHKMLVVPKGNWNESDQRMSNARYQQFFAFQRAMQEYKNRAYINGARRLVNEALGYAVHGGWDAYSDKYAVNERREKVKELLLERENTFKSRSGLFLSFFDLVLDPIFDELVECRNDKQHPLRQMFEPAKKGGNELGQIEGVRKKAATSSALMRRKEFEAQARRLGAIPVHRFYDAAVIMYEKAKERKKKKL